MWSREDLKTRAKSVLKISYWKAFLVSIVIAFAGGNGGKTSFNGSSQIDTFIENRVSYEQYPSILITLIIVSIFVVLIIAALRIFLGYPLEVGGRCYFKRGARKDIDLSYLGYAFKEGRYMNIIKTMLWRGILIFLWTLLLIIPGIVKSYAYRMVPYILSDNPNIGYKRAIELSNEMTYGHKFDIFVLDLSFLGWYLLGLLALVIGVFFVMPYENATRGELYLVLRENALENNMCSYKELNLIQPMEM